MHNYQPSLAVTTITRICCTCTFSVIHRTCYRYDELTPGESQRLAIVRALYHRPVLLFMDEATSQVDAANEEKIYELLKDRGITVVSVGHRQSIRRYHSVEIAINADTTYTVSQI